jgi:hypothetical protein
MGTPRPTHTGSKLLTLQAIQAEYGIGTGALRDLIAAGSLPAVRPPHLRRIYVLRTDLDAAVAAWREVAS